MLTQINYAQPPTYSADQSTVTRRSVLTRKQMEDRRNAAALLILSGNVSQAEISRIYRVTRTSVSRWALTLLRGESLARTVTPGRPPKLKPADVERLKAEYRTHDWNLREFGEIIYLLTEIRYSEDHVGRLVYKWGLKSKRKYRKATA